MKTKSCKAVGCHNEMPTYHHVCKVCFDMLPSDLKEKIMNDEWWRCCMEILRYLKG